MGRIHRYGQKYEVRIWNMISRDTREGQVMKRLFEKLDRMRVALGDRVFDVVNELVPGAQLEDMIMGAIWGQRNMDEIAASIDRVDEGEAQEVIDRITGQALATRYIDYSGLLEKTHIARENRLIPEYVQDFFLKAARRLNLRVEERESGYAVTWVPYENYRQYNEDSEFTKRCGYIQRRYNLITFDKDAARSHSGAEYVAPGHPLLEATTKSLLKLIDGGSLKTVYEDPNRNLDGTLWFMEGSIRDGTGEPAAQKVFCLYRDSEGAIREINPSILWDLEARVDASEGTVDGTAFAFEDEVVGESIGLVLDPFRKQISERRESEAKVKERYGLRSLSQQIMESQSKLLEYEGRAAAGESMDVVIYNERQRSQQLEVRRSELQREIRQQRNVTIAAPRVLDVALVVPAEKENGPEPGNGDEETEDLRAQVEAVGMQVALQYEERTGWEPQDVSDKNHGYDIRSIQPADDGTIQKARYIEVKGKAKTGAIRLTANEWKMARKLGDDFWLYVIADACSESPQLTRIQNPAEHFRQEEDIFATGFQVHEDSWRRKGEAVRMP